MDNKPDFETMTLKCPCCEQKRLIKFIKINTIDIGSLFDFETGEMFLNVKYCSDVPSCKEKAFNGEWVINKFFPRKNHENEKL